MIFKQFDELRALNKLIDVKINITNKITKRQIHELFFENCANCNKMAAVPQGAFAVRKIREMNQRQFLQMELHIKGCNEKDYHHGSFKNILTEEREPTPLKYNSKLMNSIWGEYNRYSVHNFKKNTAFNKGEIFETVWGSILQPCTSPTVASPTIVTDINHHV